MVSSISSSSRLAVTMPVDNSDAGAPKGSPGQEPARGAAGRGSVSRKDAAESASSILGRVAERSVASPAVAIEHKRERLAQAAAARIAVDGRGRARGSATRKRVSLTSLADDEQTEAADDVDGAAGSTAGPYAGRTGERRVTKQEPSTPVPSHIHLLSAPHRKARRGADEEVTRRVSERLGGTSPLVAVAVRQGVAAGVINAAAAAPHAGRNYGVVDAMSALAAESPQSMVLAVSMTIVKKIVGSAASDTKAVKGLNRAQAAELKKENQAVLSQIAKQKALADESWWQRLISDITQVISIVITAVQGVAELAACDPQGLATLGAAVMQGVAFGLTVAAQDTSDPTKAAQLQKDANDVGYAAMALSLVGGAIGIGLVAKGCSVAASVGAEAANAFGPMLVKAIGSATEEAASSVTEEVATSVTEEVVSNVTEEAATDVADQAIEQLSKLDEAVPEFSEMDDVDPDICNKPETDPVHDLAADVVEKMKTELSGMSNSLMKGAFSKEIVTGIVEDAFNAALKEVASSGEEITQQAVNEMIENVQKTVTDGIVDAMSAQRNLVVSLSKYGSIFATAGGKLSDGVLGLLQGYTTKDIANLKNRQQGEQNLFSLQGMDQSQWQDALKQTMTMLSNLVRSMSEEIQSSSQAGAVVAHNFRTV